MDFELSAREREVVEQARAVAAKLAPVAEELDESGVLSDELISTLRDSGLATLMVPAAYGGRTERIDPVLVTLAREHLMGTSAAADSAFALQGIGSYAIGSVGSDEQKSTWLPRIATFDAVAALALTEPHTGSDLRGITTTVVEKDGQLVINGQKSFISNAGFADVYTVLVTEEAGLSLVLVPADTPGIRISATPPLAAPHAIGEVDLVDVTLPLSSRLGEPGQGLDAVLGTLAVFRVSVAGAAVGLAESALREAARHARDRQSHGKPLARIGAVAALLADARADLEMARWVTYHAAARARIDPAASVAQASLAKVAATEAVGRVTDRCVQVMGRFGLVRGSNIERYHREARPMRIYEGANEVLRLTISRDLIEGLDP